MCLVSIPLLGYYLLLGWDHLTTSVTSRQVGRNGFDGIPFESNKEVYFLFGCDTYSINQPLGVYLRTVGTQNRILWTVNIMDED